MSVGTLSSDVPGLPSIVAPLPKHLIQQKCVRTLLFMAKANIPNVDGRAYGHQILFVCFSVSVKCQALQ